MSNARRIAERMILDRAARAHVIAQTLRTMASRLDGHEPGGAETVPLHDAAGQLRELADQIERL